MNTFTNASLKFGATGLLAAVLFIGGAASAFASTATASISALSPGSTVSVGTPVTFTIATTGFTAPTYTLTDSFQNGSLGKYDLSSMGAFAWTPAPNDVGTHNLSIIVYDDNGNTQTLQLTLTVVSAGTSVSSSSSNSSSSSTTVSPTISIQSIAPSTTVTNGQSVSFNVVTNGFSTTPSYSVSDSFNSSSVSSGDINSLGEFFWTPDANDIGTHTLTITATNSAGQTAENTVTLTVQSPTPAVSTVTTTPVVTTTSGDTTTAVSAPATTFTESLTVGSNDSQVTALQELLIAQGDMTGTATGYYGTMTEAAVKKFQTAHNISALGIVGPSTRAALNALETSGTATTDTTADTTTSASATSAGTTSTQPTVAQIQSEVQALTTQLGLIESQLAQL